MKLKTLPKIYLAYGALFIATAIWGVATSVIKLTLNEISLFSFLFYRFLIVCIIILPVIFIEVKRNPIDFGDLPNLILLGLFGQSAIILIFIGIKYTSSIDAAILGVIGSVITFSAGHYFYHEKISRPLKIGIATALTGTILVMLEPAITAKGVNTSTGLRILGNFIVILYNFSFAAYIILSKRVMGQNSDNLKKTSKFLHIKPMRKIYSPMLHTGLTFYVALATIIPFFLLESFGYLGNSTVRTSNFGLTAISGILYMAVLSSIAAGYFFEWGLKNSHVFDTAIFGYLTPLFTLPASFLLLGETVTPIAVTGASITLIGVLIAEKHKAWYTAEREKRYTSKSF